MAQQIVIAGGGVIGASCAYYLAQKGAKPIVIDACTAACSASGKAGGFLALDWCDGSPLGPLARKSFALHAELAETLAEYHTGYRPTTTHSVAIKGGTKNSRKINSLPQWVDSPSVLDSSVIGTQENTAQVHPELLTKALLSEAKKKGGQVKEHSKVVGLKFNAAGNALEGVHVRSTTEDGTEELIPADKIILALGVWSTTLEEILPPTVKFNTRIFSGLKVHSMVLADPEQQATADALFLAYRSSTGLSLEPEVYPRPDKTVYVCGVSSEEAPPPLATDIVPQEAALDTLNEVVAAVSSDLGKAEILKRQACFLPCTNDGLPLIGKIPGVEGLYISTGHSCWGILNGPATGLGMAELLVDGRATSVKLKAFDPARFC